MPNRPKDPYAVAPRQLPSGRWKGRVVRYDPDTGQRHELTQTFDTKREAKAWAERRLYLDRQLLYQSRHQRKLLFIDAATSHPNDERVGHLKRPNGWNNGGLIAEAMQHGYRVTTGFVGKAPGQCDRSVENEGRQKRLPSSIEPRRAPPRFKDRRRRPNSCAMESIAIGGRRKGSILAMGFPSARHDNGITLFDRLEQLCQMGLDLVRSELSHVRIP
jgi:hypothetical protein